jgi:hypothetical protein
MADEVETELTDEQLADEIGQHITVETPPSPESPASEPTETPPSPPGQPEVPAPETPPAAEPTDLIEIEGQKLRRAQVQALLQFKGWVESHPQEAQELDEYFAGKRILSTKETPAPTPATPPQPGQLTEDELADLPEPVRAALGELPQLRQEFQSFQQERMTEQARQIDAAITRGSTNFGQRYALNAEQVDSAKAELAESQWLPLFIQRAQGDPQRGVEDALEAIYFRNPENRKRELGRLAAANKDADRRGRNASRLSGSGGSTPRAPEVDMSDPMARRQAIIAEIAAAQSQAPTTE